MSEFLAIIKCFASYRGGARREGPFFTLAAQIIESIIDKD